MSDIPKKVFTVDMDYLGYVFLGSASGRFETKDVRKIPYYNMYVLSPVSTYESEDYKASGFKADKKKCVSPQVLAGLEPGNKVRLFFDDKGRVIEAAIDG